MIERGGDFSAKYSVKFRDGKGGGRVWGGADKNVNSNGTLYKADEE